MKERRHWIRHPYFVPLAFMAGIGGYAAGMCMIDGDWVRGVTTLVFYEIILRKIARDTRRDGDW